MLGADPMMGADQPGFDVAEKGVDDREEVAGIGAVVLDHRRVLEMLGEIGVTAAIAGKPVGQQMRIGGDIGFEKGPQFGPRRRRKHGDAGITGEEPVLALDGVPMLSAPVLRRRHLFDGSHDQALVGVGGAATGAGRVATATDKGLVRFQEAVHRTRGILAQPVAQLGCHGPGRLIRHTRARAAETWPKPRAYRGPSDRRQETTWSARFASGETPFQRSPIPAGGRPRIRIPAGAPSAAMPDLRHTRYRQIHRASEAPPNARCTAPRSQTARQTLAAQPWIPPLIDWAMLP